MSKTMTALELKNYAKKTKTKNKKTPNQISPVDKLNQRFGVDDRTFTEKYKGWRTLAYRFSYFCQIMSISGAAYAGFRLIYEPSVIGVIWLCLAIVFFFAFEKAQRWTSDEFWDSYAAGNANYGYGFLNFGVIWSMSCIMTIGGFYMVSNDSHSQVTTIDVSSLKEQISTTKGNIARIRSDYTVKSGRDKGAIKWGKDKAYQRAVSSSQATLDKLSAQLADANGVDLEYNSFVRNARNYMSLVLSLVCMILFEVCMWYCSYYDYMEFLELQTSGVKMTRRKSPPTTGKQPSLSLAV